MALLLLCARAHMDIAASATPLALARQCGPGGRTVGVPDPQQQLDSKHATSSASPSAAPWGVQGCAATATATETTATTAVAAWLLLTTRLLASSTGRPVMRCCTSISSAAGQDKASCMCEQAQCCVNLGGAATMGAPSVAARLGRSSGRRLTPTHCPMACALGFATDTG